MKYITPKLIAVASQILGAPAAFSAIVVTIDISDPSAVTFTSTLAFSQVNETRTQGDGVSFLGLFAVSTGNNTDFSGSLTPAGSGSAFSTNFVETPSNFNLFGPGATMTFSTTAPAFSGQGIDDLSFATIVSPGTTGDIKTGWLSTNHGGVVGQYLVIPEPASTMLISLGGLALMLRRKR